MDAEAEEEAAAIKRRVQEASARGDVKLNASWSCGATTVSLPPLALAGARSACYP